MSSLARNTNQSVAQLSKWTESMQKTSKPVEETYDDDFESYDDDFDEIEDAEPEPKPAPIKAVESKPPLPSKGVADNDMESLRRSLQQENFAAEKMSKESSRAPSADEKKMARNGKDIAEPKKAVSRKHDWASDMSMDIGASLSTGQFDPRQKRLDRLRKSNVLDLQTESFSQLNVPPITSYDLYHRLLRVQSTPPFKQAGAPTERDVRDMDVNTDEVSVKNADIQFSFSDDTLLLKMMELIRYRKKNKKKLGNSLRMLRQQWCATGAGAAASAASASSSSSGSLSSVDKNLAKFLQGASEAMERLLSERSGLRAQKSAATKQGGVFEAESDWVRVGGDTANGINELLRTRAVSCVSSSALLPSLLLCAYPSPANTDEDLRPHKGLYGIWDMDSPGGPVLVLEAAGAPSCCAFSATQHFVVAAGTAEGSIVLWDLREKNNYHRSRDSMDLKIEKGIRKPCFSTVATSSALREAQRHGDAREQHMGRVVVLRAIGGALDQRRHDLAVATVAGPSQFLSVDEHGVALLWITQEGTASASSTTAVAQDEHPPGLSPWSTLRLVVSRRMDLMQVFREELLRAPSPWSASGAVVVGLCPGQSSSHFLFSSALCGGDVVKVNRVGRPALPAVLQCPSTANTALQDLLLRSAAELAIPMDSASWWSLSSTLPGVTVTCMAIQETRLLPRRSTKDDDADRGTENDSNQRETTAVTASHYVLVGRSDGSIHLYDMSVASPLFVWTPALHYASSLRGARSGEPITTHPVLTVAWITATQFVVVDVEGMLCVYDLAHRPPDIPIFMDDSIRELLYRGQKTGAQKNRQIVAVELSPSPMSFDFDVPTQRSTGSSHRIYATVVLMENNNRETQIHVRRVDGQWMVDTLDAAETAQRALKEWSTRVNQSMINQNQGMSLELDSSSTRRK